MNLSKIISSVRDRFRSRGSASPVSQVLKHARTWLLPVVFVLLASASSRAQTPTYYLVDCSGANPSDYPSITSAVQAAGPNSSILVTTPCTENVFVTGATNLSIGAFYGQAVTITGSIGISASSDIYLYGLNVTNPAGDAFDIDSSQGVSLWTCSGNGSTGNGLRATTNSDVTVEGPGSFDNNSGNGILIQTNSVVALSNWDAPFDISNNRDNGVYAGINSTFNTIGLTTIENNTAPPATPFSVPSGFGIQAVGNSIVQIGTCFGPNQISGNQSGGIDMEENSELSIWSCGESAITTVSGNGPVGVTAGFGSQVTLYNNAQISGHSGPGVDLYANSQLHVVGNNLISQNGSNADPRSAGIVVDGNSEAYLRGGQIEGNKGPGILALVNSSIDFTGATFTDNSGGLVTCDSSAYMVSDLAVRAGASQQGIGCRTPHNLGNHRGISAPPHFPDLVSARNRAMRYKAMSSVAPKRQP